MVPVSGEEGRTIPSALPGPAGRPAPRVSLVPTCGHVVKILEMNDFRNQRPALDEGRSAALLAKAAAKATSGGSFRPIISLLMVRMVGSENLPYLLRLLLIQPVSRDASGTRQTFVRAMFVRSAFFEARPTA